MVKFDSAQAPALPGMPFGKGAADCLCAFLNLARNMGFATRNYDNYVGEVIFGDGAEEFAVLAHLDVVPAGDGWTHPPFAGEAKLRTASCTAAAPWTTRAPPSSPSTA